MTEYLISLVVTTVSFAITVSTTGIAIFLIRHFMSKPKPIQQNSANNTHSHSNSQMIHEANRIKIKRYFKMTASITLIFNALNAFFNSLYCLYLLFDSAHNDNVFYVYHPSHIQRITSTASWYIAKVSLVWFFSGRLYHSFKGSALSINRRVMLSINTMNTIFTPSSLFFAYWCVYKNYLILAEIAFNFWRFQYQIVVFFLLIMFSQRLLFLTVQEQSISILQCSESIKEARHHRNTSIDNIHIYSEDSKQHRLYFLMITTRNAILVFTISFNVFLVSFCFSAFRFLFGQQTRTTLLIPMNMAAFDSLMTSICIICLFSYGDNVYYSLCKCCDKNVYKLLVRVAKKQINASTSSVGLTENISKRRTSDQIISFSNNDAKNTMDRSRNDLKLMALHDVSSTSAFKSESVPLADVNCNVLEIASFSEPVRKVNDSGKINQ